MKKSIWQNSSIPNHFPTPPEEDYVDIAIIGGGISGITTALLLQNCGFSVGVYEGGTLANSNTGKSTGNLYMLVDTPLQELNKKYPIETIEKVLEARKEAVNLIESLVNKFEINCSFKRVPWTLYSGAQEMDDFIEKEFEIATKLNLSPQWLEENSTLKTIKGRIGFQILNQAQFDPYLYVNELAKKINSPNCRIYENTKIHNIKEGSAGHILESEHSRIYAKTLIHATHTPLGFSPLQTVIAPYREYGIAKKMKDFPFEDAIYWGYFSDKKMYSLRRHSDHILMIGCPHKVGQADSESYYQDLREKFLKLNISDESSETIEWSGQHFRSSDELPFIGEGFEKDTLMGTGFATDGLVYGTLSAMIFKDILLNNKNAYKDLFKPHRARSIGSKKFITENLNVLEQYVVDYLKSSSTEHPEAGEGKVLSYKGGKYAVTKDEQGEIQVCSAVCTHLGCIVHWNSAEKSWDCPCHGSRFNHKGETLEGPALKDLGEKLKEDIL